MMAYAAQTASPRLPHPPVRPARFVWRLTMTGKGAAADERAEWNLLLGRVAAGDRAAFARLFDHFAPRLKAYLMRLGTGSQAAEDLAQDAMLTLWRKAHLFDAGKASAATWIFTIARNLRIDAIRKERRPAFDPADPGLLPEDDIGADDGMEMAQSEAAVRAAMKDLSPDQVRIVELSFFADKPHSQIASELHIPLGTVKSRLRLAMARLRLALGDRP